ncbi:partner of Y14 and mago-like isoform X2 [Rutidosis leptorrhynchoides]|uniref:partner of Y14 and mago-like isoform X2 n=1 Tax=Rutidosis leptorrhynchoides TaxID=125765 RepID=UPI003A99B4EC
MGTKLKEVAEISKTLKEGERILGPTRRPDGTLRKPIRIRAGYVPQDEVAVYKSKGSQLRTETVPPGYDPEDIVVVNKSKTKAAKRNERKKEKRLSQAASDKEQNGISPSGDVEQSSGPVESIVSQINEITISGNSTECSTTGDQVPDIDKKIRALKKKIRLTEAQMQKTGHDLNPEQLEKIAKMEDWRTELKLLQESSLEVL